MQRIIYLLIILFLTGSSFYSKDNMGAEYRTRQAYLYGRFEINYKAIQKDGFLATFFTYFDGTSGDPWATSKWNEIDLEIMGRYSNEVQFNTITPGQVNHVRHHYVNFNPSNDYHTYGFEWTPDYVAWFIDGEEVYRQTGAHIASLNRPQKIMMNVWNPAYPNWAGEADPASLPAFSFYDWVSYYSYTPGSGTYGTDNNFTFQWKDEFDTFDQGRWQKATHTWSGNNTQFTTDNAVIKDGKLILCLTDNTNTGYTDQTPPSISWARMLNSTKIKVMFTEEVEKNSAENIANYFINGVVINSAELLPDEKSVMITCEPIDTSLSYNLILMGGIKDQFIPANVTSVKAKAIFKPNYPSFPLKVNVGGAAYQDFLPDQPWAPDKNYGYMDGSPAQTSAAILGTELDPVYQTDRSGLVKYRVAAPDGIYNFKLMFSENYFSQAGRRMFDVYINGKKVVDSLDLYAKLGKNVSFDITSNNVEVTDNLIEISFGAYVDNGQLNGLIVEQVSITGINEINTVPSEFNLYQNYPNPFNGQTVIKYFIPQKDNLTFLIYDTLGNLIYKKSLGEKEAGTHQINWDSASEKGRLSSGVYFYSLKGEFAEASKKLIILN